MEFALKSWQQEHIKDVSKHANNKKIAANLRDGFSYPYTEAHAAEFVQSMQTADTATVLGRAIVVEQQAVGSIAIFKKDNVYQKSAELGYWLAEPYWGRGIMTRAIRQMCALAFEQYDIARIFAEPYANNRGSRRALEKAGFTLEGILRDSVFKNGELQDSCVYALLRADLQ